MNSDQFCRWKRISQCSNYVFLSVGSLFGSWLAVVARLLWQHNSSFMHYYWPIDHVDNLQWPLHHRSDLWIDAKVPVYRVFKSQNYTKLTQRLSTPSWSSPFEVCHYHLKLTLRIGRTASLEVWAHLTPQMRITILGRSPSMCQSDLKMPQQCWLQSSPVYPSLRTWKFSWPWWVPSFPCLTLSVISFSFRKRCMVPASQECQAWLQAIAYHLPQRVQKLIQRILTKIQAVKTTSLSSRLEVVAMNLCLLQRWLQRDSTRKSRQLQKTLV